MADDILWGGGGGGGVVGGYLFSFFFLSHLALDTGISTCWPGKWRLSRQGG